MQVHFTWTLTGTRGRYWDTRACAHRSRRAAAPGDGAAFSRCRVKLPGWAVCPTPIPKAGKGTGAWRKPEKTTRGTTESSSACGRRARSPARPEMARPGRVPRPRSSGGDSAAAATGRNGTGSTQGAACSAGTLRLGAPPAAGQVPVARTQRSPQPSFLSAAHKLSLRAGRRSLPPPTVKRAERQPPQPMAALAAAPQPMSGGGRPDPRQPPRPGSAGSAARTPGIPRPRRRLLPAHRPACLRLLLVRESGTVRRSSPPSPAAPRVRGRAAGGRLAELLAGGAGTELLSAPRRSCQARKHPGIPEDGAGRPPGSASLRSAPPA